MDVTSSEICTVSISDSVSRIGRFQQSIKDNVFGTFDVNKLHAAFDVLFGLIRTQQEQIDKITEKQSTIEAKQRDIDEESGRPNNSSELLLEIKNVMDRLSAVESIIIPSIIPGESAEAEKVDNELDNDSVGGNFNSTEAEQIGDSYLKSSTGAKYDTGPESTKDVDDDNALDAIGDHSEFEPDVSEFYRSIAGASAVASAVASRRNSEEYAPDNFDASTDQDKNHSSNASSRRQSRDIRISGMRTRSPSLRLQRERAKRVENAKALSLRDKKKFDHEHLLLLQERVCQQETFTKELEGRIDEHKRALDVVPSAIMSSLSDVTGPVPGVSQLMALLEENGGIQRLFDAISDLGFETGESPDHDNYDSNGKLHVLVRGISRKIFGDIEIQVQTASAHADAASHSATRAVAAAISASDDAIAVGAKVGGLQSFLDEEEEGEGEEVGLLLRVDSEEFTPFEQLEGNQGGNSPIKSKASTALKVPRLIEPSMNGSRDSSCSPKGRTSSSPHPMKTTEGAGEGEGPESDSTSSQVHLIEEDGEAMSGSQSTRANMDDPDTTHEHLHQQPACGLHAEDAADNGTPLSNDRNAIKETKMKRRSEIRFALPELLTNDAAPIPSTQQRTQDSGAASAQLRPDQFSKLPPSLMRAIQELLRTANDSKVDLSDFNALLKEMQLLKSQLLYRDELIAMLAPPETGSSPDCTSSKLRRLILSIVKRHEVINDSTSVITPADINSYSNSNKSRQTPTAALDTSPRSGSARQDKKDLDTAMKGHLEKLRMELRDAVDAESSRNKLLVADMARLRSDLNDLHHSEDMSSKDRDKGDEDRRKKDRTTGWRPEVAKINDSVKKFTSDQVVSLNQFLAELQKLQSQVELRPSEEKLQAMVDSMDATFKRQLGENVIGLKLSVGQVLKLVQQKANKEDVLTLLSKSMSAVDDTIAGLADREASSVAGTVKCISCGTNYAPKGRPNGGGGDSPERGTRHLSSRSQYYGPSNGIPINASPETFRLNSMNAPGPSQNQYALTDSNLNGMTAAEYSRMEAEEYLAVIKRQGGLKPLARHTQPLQARANPYPYRNTDSASTRRAAAAAAVQNEPSYRKSRLAQHLKEMTKIPHSERFTQSHTVHMDDEDSVRSSPIENLLSQSAPQTGVGAGSGGHGFDPPHVISGASVTFVSNINHGPNSICGSTGSDKDL